MLRRSNDNHGDDPPALNHIQSSWADTAATSATDRTSTTKTSSSATSFYESWKSEIASLKNRLDRQLQNMVEHSQHEIDILSAAVTGHLQIQPSNEYEISSVTDITKDSPPTQTVNLHPKVPSSGGSITSSTRDLARNIHRTLTDASAVSRQGRSMTSTFQVTGVATALGGPFQTTAIQKTLFDDQEISPKSIQILRNQQTRWIKQRRRLNQRLMSTPRSQRTQTPTTTPGSPRLLASASNMSVGNRSERTEPKSNLTRHVTARRIRNFLVPSHSSSSVVSGLGSLVASSNHVNGAGGPQQQHDERSLGGSKASSDMSHNSYSDATSPLPLAHAATPPINYPAPIDEEEDGQMTTDEEDENRPLTAETSQQNLQSQQEKLKIFSENHHQTTRKPALILSNNGENRLGNRHILGRTFLGDKTNNTEMILFSSQLLEESISSSPEISESLTPESQTEATITTRQETERDFSILRGTQKRNNTSLGTQDDIYKVSCGDESQREVFENIGESSVDENFASNCRDEYYPCPQRPRGSVAFLPNQMESYTTAPQIPSEVSSMLSSPQSSLSSFLYEGETSQRYFDPVVELRKKSETPVNRSFFSIFDRIDALRSDQKEYSRGCDAPASKFKSNSLPSFKKAQENRPDAPVSDEENEGNHIQKTFEKTSESTMNHGQLRNMHIPNKQQSRPDSQSSDLSSNQLVERKTPIHYEKIPEHTHTRNMPLSNSNTLDLPPYRTKGEPSVKHLHGRTDMMNDPFSITFMRESKASASASIEPTSATAGENLKNASDSSFSASNFSKEGSNYVSGIEPVLRDARTNPSSLDNMTAEKQNSKHAYLVNKEHEDIEQNCIDREGSPETIDHNAKVEDTRQPTQGIAVPNKTHDSSHEPTVVKSPSDLVEKKPCSMNDWDGLVNAAEFSLRKTEKSSKMAEETATLAEYKLPSLPESASKSRGGNKSSSVKQIKTIEKSQYQQNLKHQSGNVLDFELDSRRQLTDRNEILATEGCDQEAYVGKNTIHGRTPEIKTREEQNLKSTQPRQVSNYALHDHNGDIGKYTGCVVDGFPHGLGTMNYADGRTYTGEWQVGRWHGHGKSMFPNGDTYTGDYYKDQRHGVGRYEWNDGRVYDGYFERDHRHGKGVYSWPDGSVYTGDFKTGLRHGHGSYTFANGSVYTGDWENGRYHGKGEILWNDGRGYQGDWKHGRAHGFGIETKFGVVRHQGQWANNKPVYRYVKDNDAGQKLNNATGTRQKHAHDSIENSNATGNGDIPQRSKREIRQRQNQESKQEPRKGTTYNGTDIAKNKTVHSNAGGKQRDDEINRCFHGQGLNTSRQCCSAVEKGGEELPMLQKEATFSKLGSSTIMNQGNDLKEDNAKWHGPLEGMKHRSQSSPLQKVSATTPKATKTEHKRANVVEARRKRDVLKSASKGGVPRGGPKTSDMLEHSMAMQHSNSRVTKASAYGQKSKTRQPMKSGKTEDNPWLSAGKNMTSATRSNPYPMSTEGGQESNMNEFVSSNQVTVTKNVEGAYNQNQYVILLHGARVDTETERLWREFCKSRKNDIPNLQNKPIYIVGGDIVGGEDAAGFALQAHDPALGYASMKKSVVQAQESVSAFLKVAHPTKVSSDSPITRPSNTVIPNSGARVMKSKRTQWNQSSHNPVSNIPVVVGTECDVLPGNPRYLQHTLRVAKSAESDSGIIDGRTYNPDAVEMNYINRLKTNSANETIARMKSKLQGYNAQKVSCDHGHLDQRDELVVIRD